RQRRRRAAQGNRRNSEGLVADKAADSPLSVRTASALPRPFAASGPKPPNEIRHRFGEVNLRISVAVGTPDCPPTETRCTRLAARLRSRRKATSHWPRMPASPIASTSAAGATRETETRAVGFLKSLKRILTGDGASASARAYLHSGLESIRQGDFDDALY